MTVILDRDVGQPFDHPIPLSYYVVEIPRKLLQNTYHWSGWRRGGYCTIPLLMDGVIDRSPVGFGSPYITYQRFADPENQTTRVATIPHASDRCQ